MKLYRVDATKEDAKDDFSSWIGTQAEAASLRKTLNSVKGYRRDNITTLEVEVPTTKKELLEFLNQL